MMPLEFFIFIICLRFASVSFGAPQVTSVDLPPNRPTWTAEEREIALTALEYTDAAFEIFVRPNPTVDTSRSWRSYCINKCTGLTAGTELVELLDRRTFTTDSKGFVAKNDRLRWIIVSYRGSTNFQNIINSLSTAPTTWSVGGQTVASPDGLYDNYQVTEREMLDAVTRLAQENPEYRIVATGYSLGGTAATIASAVIDDELSRNPNIAYNTSQMIVFSFGAQQVADPRLASYYRQSGIEHRRFVHERDAVPLLPLGGTWEHVGQEWFEFGPTVYKCRGNDDPECSDRYYGDLNNEFRDIARIGDVRTVAVDHLRYLGRCMGFACAGDILRSPLIGVLQLLQILAKFL